MPLTNPAPHAPAAWLVDNIDLIRPGARVLDVAAGRGRNTLFLAGTGRVVHAVDSDAQALRQLQSMMPPGARVTTEVLDLESGAPNFGVGTFDAVIVFNYLHRSLMPAIIGAVALGGVLIYETFTVGQAQRGHPRNPAFLLRDGELPTLVAPLDILRSREGEFDGKLVSSVVAMRR